MRRIGENIMRDSPRDSRDPFLWSDGAGNKRITPPITGKWLYICNWHDVRVEQVANKLWQEPRAPAKNFKALSWECNLSNLIFDVLILHIRGIFGICFACMQTEMLMRIYYYQNMW